MALIQETQWEQQRNMVKVDDVKLNITADLQNLLKENPDKKVKKAVINPKKDSFGNLVPKTDEDGNVITKDAIVSTHSKVYFDGSGNYYFNVFRSKQLEVDGKTVDILITNPNIKTDKDCNLYAKGLESHRLPIPGSEFWDNGKSGDTVHRELVCKGDPLTKIVKVLTRDEVLAIEIKPQGNNILANIANSTSTEKAAMLEMLLGKDLLSQLKEIGEKGGLPE